MQFVQFHQTGLQEVHRPRILIVDDHPALLRSLARYLRRHGCEVETAAHGQEGLARLDGERFDAIVSDVQMPGMDGVAFRSAALQRDPTLRHRFLLCSGLPLPQPLAADPAVHYLPKPFDGAELWEALAPLLATQSEPSGGTGARARGRGHEGHGVG